jgi:hypothetical protein
MSKATATAKKNFSHLQKEQPKTYMATSGPNGALVEFNNVVWYPLATVKNDPTETVRTDDELGDDAQNYAALQEKGDIFPPIVIYPDKVIRDGRTRHSMWNFSATALNIDPALYFIPCVIVDKPKRLGDRLLDAFCDNAASYAPRKMTKDDLREIIWRCREDGLFQSQIRTRLINDSDFGASVIEKLITEVDTNRQRTKRQAVLKSVTSGVLTPDEGAKAINAALVGRKKWTPDMVKRAAEGEVVGFGGNEGTLAMRRLHSTLKPMAKSLAQNFRQLKEAIDRHEIASDMYEQTYDEVGQYITNLVLAHGRAKRLQVTTLVKPTK